MADVQQPISVDFAATINLMPSDLEDAYGDLAQAVQNAIGHSGAQVYPGTVERS